MSAAPEVYGGWLGDSEDRRAFVVVVPKGYQITVEPQRDDTVPDDGFVVTSSGFTVRDGEKTGDFPVLMPGSLREKVWLRHRFGPLTAILEALKGAWTPPGPREKP